MVSRKFKRIISAILLLCFIAVQIPLLLNVYMFEYSNRYFLTVEEAAEMEFDCVLVLGAGVWGDSPSHMLEERLNKGIEVYKTGCTDRLLMPHTASADLPDHSSRWWFCRWQSP